MRYLEELALCLHFDLYVGNNWEELYPFTVAFELWPKVMSPGISFLS